MQTIKLNNGITCPVIGLGTFMLSPADAQKSAHEALKMGYRLIDTATAYVNERAVGRGIKESGIDRKEIFLSTKLWPSEYENPNAVDETLERLGVDYVDLLYIYLGIEGTVSLKRHSAMEKPAQSAFLILKGNIFKNLKLNGKLPLSSFRWKPIHILHRRICA